MLDRYAMCYEMCVEIAREHQVTGCSSVGLSFSRCKLYFLIIIRVPECPETRCVCVLGSLIEVRATLYVC